MVSKLYELYSNFYSVNYFSDSFTALPQQVNENHTTDCTSSKNYYTVSIYTKGDRGDTVVKVLCYKSEGRWFDPRLCPWNFSLT